MRGSVIIKALWRWSWLLTLPVSIVFVLWAYSTSISYYKTSLRIKVDERPLLDEGRKNFLYIVYGASAGLFPEKRSGGDGLAVIHLYAKEGNISKLDARLPYSGRESVNAHMMYPDGKMRKIKMRYRGDFSIHWADPKKSLRIKTQKDALYRGMRAFNLIVLKTSDALNNYLSYVLARRMGILAPEADLVKVYLNGKYRGLYLLLEQPGEQFLRRSGKLPGDLFVGDMIGRDSYQNINNRVMQNTEFWTKAAVNNHFPEGRNEHLKALLRSIYTEDMETFMSLLDIEAWAKFSAYMTLCRTRHYSLVHNWRLYFDPAMGKFLPVVWDPVGWLSYFETENNKRDNQLDIITNFILERMHRDHMFILHKQKAMDSFFSSSMDARLLDLLKDTSSFEDALANDRYFLITRGVGSSKSEIRRFRAALAASFKAVRAQLYDARPSLQYALEDDGVIRLNVDMSQSVERLEIQCRGQSPAASRVTLAYIGDNGRVEKDVTRLVDVSGCTIGINVPLFPVRQNTFLPYTGVEEFDMKVLPATYFISVKGLDSGTITGIRARYASGRMADVERKDQSLKVNPILDNYNVIPVDKEYKSVTWRGRVDIETDMEVRGDLVIERGTVVRLAPGASVFVHGRLHAKGTAGAPIRFVPKSEGAGPWGALVLIGPGASGSILQYCELSGGSGAARRFVEYSGMLSLHGVSDVLLEGCVLSGNRRVDDAFHAVYSDIRLINCALRDTNMDAIDLDISSARIDGLRIDRAGNDALDLMTSTVVITNSILADSKDKGISAGEGTSILVWNCGLVRNNIGVQVKEAARAVVYNSDLTENGKAADAYRKNWQYETGGSARLIKCRIKGGSGEAALTADKDSEIEVYDSFFTGKVGGDKGRVTIDVLTDSDESYDRRAKSARSFSEMLYPGMIKYSELLRNEVRGMVEPER